jgi:CRP/FNR family cyclic AMP-dependent transcriptional regulator
VAARLLLAISKRLSDHLREANRKLMTFTQVSRALQQELDAAHAINRPAAGAQGPIAAG